MSDDVFSKAGRKLQFGASTHQCLYDRERRTVQVRITGTVPMPRVGFLVDIDGEGAFRVMERSDAIGIATYRLSALVPVGDVPLGDRSGLVTVEVRIPVAVREDGAVFVWEMDGSDPKRRHSAGPALSSRRPDRLYYYDLDGKTPSDDGEHRWGNVNVHWVTAAVPLPAPADHVTHGRVE